jgi:hypothetical protein
MILRGNLENEKIIHPERRGWFLGWFIDKPKEFNHDDFELRWGVHKKGERKETLVVNSLASTITILISGKVKWILDNEEHTLNTLGDFIFWSAGVKHEYVVLEDCVTITIRWPSKKGDQKIVK